MHFTHKHTMTPNFKPAAKFSPTQAMIEAAQDVFIAMALRDTIKLKFEAIERSILEAGNYQFTEDERGLEYDTFKDGRIREPKYSYMMKGVTDYNTPEWVGSDAARYSSELSRITQNAGFIRGENTFCTVDWNVNKFESAFINATTPIHGMNSEDVSDNMKHREQLLRLTLGMFAGLVNKTDMEPKKRKYFDEYIKA